MSAPPTAALLIIGNEILSGRTQDANLAHLGQELEKVGILLAEARVVRDDFAAIAAALLALSAAYDHVFTTGGIGPTHDDITAEAVARAFGVALTTHPEARARLEAHYPPDKLTANRLLMARTPEGATLIDNPVSTAPGFTFGNVHVMAGVPVIMQGMLATLLPRLGGATPIQSRTVQCPWPESQIAEALAAIQGEFADVEIGSYPWFTRGKVGTALVLKGRDGGRLDAAAAAVEAMVAGLAPG